MQKENIVLMGDAAGITNPLTKGGMACCVFASEILGQCIREGKVAEYEQRLRSHPVLAPEYKIALQYFQELTNEELDRFGTLVNGQDLRHLSRGLKLKLLIAALAKRKKMKNLMRAASCANKYSW